jgi:hypothetical protein
VTMLCLWELVDQPREKNPGPHVQQLRGGGAWRHILLVPVICILFSGPCILWYFLRGPAPLPWHHTTVRNYSHNYFDIFRDSKTTIHKLSSEVIVSNVSELAGQQESRGLPSFFPSPLVELFVKPCVNICQ